MKANELRIGNYINWEQTTHIVSGLPSVNMIGSYWVKDDVVMEEEQYNGFVEEAKPIPLDEDWLLKFGFKKEIYTTSDPDYFDEICYELEYNVGHINEFFMSYADDFSLGLFSSKKAEEEELGITPNFKDIKYVHQLQNLYFSLTGEELEIK